MKPLEISFWIYVGIVAGIPLFCLAAKAYGKRKRKMQKLEDRYNRLYYLTQRAINDAEPYPEVKSLFDQLKNLKWDNPEKTRVLHDQIERQYSKEARVERDKFIKASLMKHIEKREIVKI